MKWAVYLVGDGSEHAWRCHYRSPCFVHLQLLGPMGKGGLVADMVATIGSIDIVMGEVDHRCTSGCSVRGMNPWLVNVVVGLLKAVLIVTFLAVSALFWY